MKRWWLGSILALATACHALLPVGPVGEPVSHHKGRLQARLALEQRDPRWRLQATRDQIDHVTLELIPSDGIAVPSDITPVATRTLLPPFTGTHTVDFSNVPDGVYRLRGAAFATADSSLPITVGTGGWSDSENVATVLGTAASYSSGNAFDLRLQLADGGIGIINVNFAGLAGTSWASSLFAVGSDAKASWESPQANFKYKRVGDGTYQVWISERTGAGIATVARPTVNTVTVNGPTVTYSNGDTKLTASATGQIQTPALTVPPLGAPLTAEFGALAGMSVTAGGDVYVVDADWQASNSGTNRLYKLAGGVLSVVAGDDTKGYSGDGGPATAAQVRLPGGVAVEQIAELAAAGLLVPQLEAELVTVTSERDYLQGWKQGAEESAETMRRELKLTRDLMRQLTDAGNATMDELERSVAQVGALAARIRNCCICLDNAGTCWACKALASLPAAATKLLDDQAKLEQIRTMLKDAKTCKCLAIGRVIGLEVTNAP